MHLVTAAIIKREGRVLIARRSPNSKLPGQWEFPGGKVEEGESLEKCLRRELLEELGIDVEVGNHFMASDYHYTHGSFRIESFEVNWIGGELTLIDHDKVEWVLVGDLEKYPLLPADVPIARSLIARQSS
jgi:mutator protein MutT